MSAPPLKLSIYFSQSKKKKKKKGGGGEERKAKKEKQRSKAGKEITQNRFSLKYLHKRDIGGDDKQEQRTLKL